MPLVTKEEWQGITDWVTKHEGIQYQNAQAALDTYDEQMATFVNSAESVLQMSDQAHCALEQAVADGMGFEKQIGQMEEMSHADAREFLKRVQRAKMDALTQQAEPREVDLRQAYKAARILEEDFSTLSYNRENTEKTLGQSDPNCPEEDRNKIVAEALRLRPHQPAGKSSLKRRPAGQNFDRKESVEVLTAGSPLGPSDG